MLDDLRSHFIISWLAALVIGTIAIVVAGATNRGGFELDAYAFRFFVSFSGTLLPLLGAMIGSYFSTSLKDIEISRGQKRVAYLVSYIYLTAVLGIDFWCMFGAGQATIARDPFGLVITFSALITAIVSFIFGRGKKPTRRAPPRKNPTNAASATEEM